MKNFLSAFPGPDVLLTQYPHREVLEVNAHLHTPYSFSAFTDIRQIFSLAVKENIAAAGINDFFVTDGYEPFCSEALKTGVFPLFNIEFIGLLKEEQQRQVRINDPNNPGRCYFSGKGLDYPFHLEERLLGKLNKVVRESQEQVRSMVFRANAWFEALGEDIRLDFDLIRRDYAKELVRERHIAKAIREAVFKKHSGDEERQKLFTRIFGGKSPKSALKDIPGLENEIRGNLLKSGGKAFVEEDDNAFLPIEEIIEIITGAGGIPCYPVLLDDRNGNYTEYESDPVKLHFELTRRGIRCIELIPGRNDAGHLESFVRFFHKKGFIILFGTEHNTPEMVPLTCDTRGNAALHDDMRRISWEGTCAVAAHQYLRATGMDTEEKFSSVSALTSLGNAVIHHFKNHYKL